MPEYGPKTLKSILSCGKIVGKVADEVALIKDIQDSLRAEYIKLGFAGYPAELKFQVRSIGAIPETRRYEVYLPRTEQTDSIVVKMNADSGLTNFDGTIEEVSDGRTLINTNTNKQLITILNSALSPENQINAEDYFKSRETAKRTK
jgi:hypothetical protein